MIFWRGKASYLYSTGRVIPELQRKLKEHLGLLEDDSDSFRETLGNQGNLQEGFSEGELSFGKTAESF